MRSTPTHEPFLGRGSLRGLLPATISHRMTGSDFKIDLEEEFPHLNKAPIIEAIIEIRARAESPWEESDITNRLKAELPDYPTKHSLNAVQQEFVFGVQQPQGALQDLGWAGLRMQSADKLYVAQFNRNNFVFSRLHPYENWEDLEKEARRLWALHAQLARPSEAQRLGVRFINRIQMPAQERRFEDYIDPHPETPRGLDLPYLNFLYRETLVVPGHEYGINLTRALQHPQDEASDGIAIILDIDVFTMQPFTFDAADLDRRLTAMRWLKNKSFFGTITSKALEGFR
jgi:uncharacterized protein (TIGR04255 family)